MTNTDTVRIGTEDVNLGDSVAENLSPWIKATVTEITAGAGFTEVTVAWQSDERHGNLIARKGGTRKYVVNGHGVSSIRKVR